MADVEDLRRDREEDTQRIGIFENAPVSDVTTSEAKWNIDRDHGDASRQRPIDEILLRDIVNRRERVDEDSVGD